MNALTMSASRRRRLIGRAALPKAKNVVILTGPALGAKYSTPASVSLYRALSMVCRWIWCNCTPRNIVRALFSAKVSTAVAVACVSAIWWHALTVANIIEAREAVATDLLWAMPWALVWTIRATRMPMPEEGGEA